MLMGIVAIAVVIVILAASVRAGRSRDPDDVEISTDRVRGPSDDGGLGGF